jgi:hypothetical protein
MRRRSEQRHDEPVSRTRKETASRTIRLDGRSRNYHAAVIVHPAVADCIGANVCSLVRVARLRLDREVVTTSTVGVLQSDARQLGDGRSIAPGGRTIRDSALAPSWP